MKFIVFTMDCIASKKVNNATSTIELMAQKLSDNPLRNYRFITEVKVLVGDEIQVVMKYNTEFVKHIRFIREAFYPLRLRIGIGIGSIDNMENLVLRDPWKLNGSAFHYARQSLEFLKNNTSFGNRGLSYLCSENRHFDLVINSQIMLYDTLLDSWSDKTYEAIALKEQYGSFRKLDGINHISSSAYTKRASAGNWVVIDTFEHNIQQIVSEYNIDEES